MTPDMEYMRNELKRMYDSPNWRRKVNRMPDSQVTAIYMREFADPPKQKPKQPPKEDIPF